jgi:hypothetical protein
MIGEIQYREIDINTDKRSTFLSARSAAHLIMHERMHWLWGKDHTFPAVLNDRNGEHTALDNQANRLLNEYGL